jgi:N-acetyl-beta-hexosaminidase
LSFAQERTVAGLLCVLLQHAAELNELREFATLRGVTCVGEMDVPGHSTGLIAALPGQHSTFITQRSVAKRDPEKT